MSTILLIDQDTSILEMLQISLTRAGYTVRIAVDGNAGLRLARTEKPDLIALDILLPSLSGVELCQALKNDPGVQNIPIFLISALTVPPPNTPWRSTPDSELRALNYQAYLPKPVDLKQFLRKVDAILHPEKASQQATGPSILLLYAEESRREAIFQALKEQDYYVSAYDRLIKPLGASRSYPPVVLVVDQAILSPDLWSSLKQFKKRNPASSVVVLQNKTSVISPEDFHKIDVLIPSPHHPWQVVKGVHRALEYQSIKKRVSILSRQLLALNNELVDTKNTLLAQNRELEFINRRLHKLSELKELLTGMLVHDLKAPLTAMMGAMQFLTMDPDNSISEGSSRILNGGLAAGKQLQRLTETLLDEQKLENNQLVFDIEASDFEDILSTSAEMMAPLLNMHKITLDIQIPSEMPMLLADPIILQRIIENLLDNAVKYSPINERIAVRAIPKGDMVEICVADRGEGIPPEHRDAIFDRFTQLDTETTEKMRGGVGLGLTFCKLAVETMGGEIWVDSLDGVGAAFYFTLPILTEKFLKRLDIY